MTRGSRFSLGLALLSIVPILLSACSSKIDELRTMCEKYANLEIVNDKSWVQYKADLSDKDLFGDSGDPYIRAFKNYKTEIKSVRIDKHYTKERITLSENGDVVAKLISVSSQWTGFDAQQHASCTTAFPNLYLDDNVR